MVSTEQLYTIFRQCPVVCTDTRQLTPGCLFFALKGGNFDGNQFARFALDHGAGYAVVDDPQLPPDERFLQVENVLTTLQQLARHHRRQFMIPVIGIGGSNGKTTTKELVAAVLSSHYPAHFTKGNLNNHIGVPLTLLAMPDDTEVAIIEMGANHPGEITELCQIAEPTHGLVTNIGKEHLEGFGSLAGVKKAEGELYRYLGQKGGCAFVNGSEKYLNSMTRSNRRKFTYAQTETLNARQDAFAEVQLLRQTPYVAVAFLDEQGGASVVQSKLFGRHNFHNIMTAIALGTYFKVPAPKIKAAIEDYTPANNRSQILQRDSNTYILDAYNANPSSMEAALDSFAVMEAPIKVAILGDMLELGADSPKEHAAILRRAARLKQDHLLLVGAEFAHTDFQRYKALHFANATDAKTWLDAQHFRDTLFLIKGSRGIRLEGVL